LSISSGISRTNYRLDDKSTKPRDLEKAKDPGHGL